MLNTKNRVEHFYLYKFIKSSTPAFPVGYI